MLQVKMRPAFFYFAFGHLEPVLIDHQNSELLAVRLTLRDFEIASELVALWIPFGGWRQNVIALSFDQKDYVVRFKESSRPN
jgi:hypothetical protein